jgi:L-rhamnose mutarotase
MTAAPRRIHRAFVLRLAPGHAEEYARRHNPIWPELADLLKAHGVRHYAIFHLPTTHQLFGYMEIEDEARWAAIYDQPVYRRWRAFMRPLLESHPDDSPVITPLDEMFHLP